MKLTVAFWCSSSIIYSGTASIAQPVPGLTDYCPDTAVDFKKDYGHPQFNGSGWYTKGGGRVSSKSNFNLAGGFIEFDMDLTKAHGGINNNVYGTFPKDGHTYCDANSHKHPCKEFDFTENNGHCHQATTWHRSGHDHGGKGHQGSLNKTVHIKVTWSDDGHKSNVSVGTHLYHGEGYADDMKKYGLKIYSSQWKGWVPGHCKPGGYSDSIYRVENLRIRGRVVKGPVPRKCSSSQPVAANVQSVASNVVFV